MTGTVDARLAQLGIELPDAPSPVANYVPYVVSGGLVFVSGQLPSWKGELRWVGKVGDELTAEEGANAARLCGLNLIAQVRAACHGDLDRVRRVVKLGGFVNCAPSFVDHPQVVNSASDLMVEIFGDAGRHARFAVGAPSLPLDVAVELDGVFQID